MAPTGWNAGSAAGLEPLGSRLDESGHLKPAEGSGGMPHPTPMECPARTPALAIGTSGSDVCLKTRSASGSVSSVRQC